jgi:hypothetical protein
MKMISLKNSPAEKKKMSKGAGLAPTSDSGDNFPYWSRLTLSGEQLEKMSALDGIKAGAMVRVTALAKVKEVVTVDAEPEKGRDVRSDRVELQLEQMAIEEADDVAAAEGFNEAQED